MILATSGLQGVTIWRFLFYSDMSSGDGRLQKSPDLLARPKKIAKKKRAEMSTVVVSPALKNSA
jgi:hypothetical protein